ncbi:hypothetical protein PHPALM_29054 [Phytophthora palmivora]|uniref:Probable RNA polymerase II nuclear localization protein SLC7A6OS n=1 Tax=Phytophthora palmivora TaxID=4796 RepID=A0A2P4X8J8_9STRA|nr:hypothetical protein PHPALM_29054 [Phytophthora palmivora]
MMDKKPPTPPRARVPKSAEVNDKPSFVFLRLKRKRTDDPMECLVVHSEPDSKRSKGSQDLLQAFTKLSTTEKRFVFKHIDTMDEAIAPGRARWTERLKRKARSLKDERADMRAKKQPVAVFQTDPTASTQTEKRVKQQQSRSKARRKQEMLKSRGLQPAVEIKEKQTMELHGIRLVDLQVSSAPSVEKRDDEILEKSKADAVTVNGTRLKPTRQDWEGATAAIFAKRGGHANVETALLACEEAEHEKDYVYDVYCVDISASEGQDNAHDIATSSERDQTSVNGVPVVSVSSEVHRWLSEDLPSDEVEEYMLESDIDSNEEVDGLSEDSNDEDNVANDYPDEESSDESLADSEDLDEIGARRRWQNSEDDYTERDDFDY